MQQVVIPVPPTPPVPPGGIPGGVSPEFATQMLRTEMAVLRKELNDRAAQLVPGMTPAREEAISEQISATRERLESVQEQLDRTLSGQPVITYTEERPNQSGPAIPDEVMDVIQWGMITLVIIALGTPMVRLPAPNPLEQWPQAPAREDAAARRTGR